MAPFVSSSAGGESEIGRSTRRSIRKIFPLGVVMSKGSDNPITLHSVDDQLFRAIWSLIAETMCVTLELSRTTKEAIATRVSERNTCPVCIAAHTMMSVVSITVDATENDKAAKPLADAAQTKQHEQALQYTDMLLEEMNRDICGNSNDKDKDNDAIPSSSGHSNSSLSSHTRTKKARKKKFSHLNDTAKAEVALVVLLFDHMNRVVSVVMGEEMSTAMFGVPRSMAKAMEKPSTIKAMSKFLSPILSGSFHQKHSPGLTLGLFPEEDQMKSRRALPSELQGLLLAGLERANAVGRLVDWVEAFEQRNLVDENVMNQDLIAFLERETRVAHPDFYSPAKVQEWVESTSKDNVNLELDEELSKAIAMVLLLATFAPKTAYQSRHWKAVVDHVGSDTARSIVAWWSLRSTLKEAKGLDKKIDKETMQKLLSGDFFVSRAA